jgi:hypothetical protein
MKPTLLLALLLSAALGACAPAYYVEVEHEPVIAPMPPPADLGETPPPMPWPDAVWTRGYWYWTGENYAWVPGLWSRPPAVGFVWVHPGWIFIEGIFRFMPGRWAHPHRVPRYPYYRHPPHHGPRHR